MPIYIDEIPGLSLKEAMERAQQGDDIQIVTHEILDERIKKIAREAQALQRPENLLYVANIPGVNDLSEGQIVNYISGVTYRRYMKLNGAIRFWVLT